VTSRNWLMRGTFSVTEYEVLDNRNTFLSFLFAGGSIAVTTACKLSGVRGQPGREVQLNTRNHSQPRTWPSSIWTSQQKPYCIYFLHCLPFAVCAL